MIRPLLWLSLMAVSVPMAAAQDASLEKRLLKLHGLSGGSYCEVPEGGFVPEDSFSSWTFSYTPSWGGADDAQDITLFRVFCGAGAYNIQHAYYWLRDYEGLQPLAFAAPTYEAVYANDDIDAGLESLTVTGMGAQTILVNSEFDPETLTVTSTSLWRGIGDVSSSGTWIFDDGEFRLDSFAIDASYDGEMNPETVVDYGAAGD